MWLDAGQYEIAAHSIVREVLDLVWTQTDGRITLQDLIRSGTGFIVVGILCSLDVFNTYDSRELIEQAAALGAHSLLLAEEDAAQPAVAGGVAQTKVVAPPVADDLGHG
jgi:hypothetical protein